VVPEKMDVYSLREGRELKDLLVGA
jgi:hypothetical protein